MTTTSADPPTTHTPVPAHRSTTHGLLVVHELAGRSHERRASLLRDDCGWSIVRPLVLVCSTKGATLVRLEHTSVREAVSPTRRAKALLR